MYAEAYPTLLGLMVQHDQVSVLEVEAVQFIAGSLGIHDIFVDDESGALGVSSDALANLAVDGMLARGLFTNKHSRHCVVRMERSRWRTE